MNRWVLKSLFPFLLRLAAEPYLWHNVAVYIP